MRGKPWLAGVGGNGGLSLRRRSQAVQCLDAAARQPGVWEDAFFVETLARLGHSVAPADTAREFAVERLRCAAPCGLHKVYNYLDVAEIKRLLDGVERAYEAMLEAAKS